MKNLAKKAFTKMVNNWIIKPIQSIRDSEFPSLELMAAILTLGITPMKQQQPAAVRAASVPRLQK